MLCFLVLDIQIDHWKTQETKNTRIVANRWTKIEWDLV